MTPKTPDSFLPMFLRCMTLTRSLMLSFPATIVGRRKP